jgi:DNA-binding transcriptional regulator YhcF (GntR family)
MNNNNGWIKLHRKILENPTSSNLELLGLWSYILLNINHKPSDFYLGFQKIHLESGQGIFSQKKLSEKFKVSLSKIHRMLKILESEKQIEKQGESKYTVITVINWELYQNIEKENENQTETKQKTNRKQIETNNNDKNIKNDKNDKKQIQNIYISPKIQNTFEESLGVELSKSKANVSAEKTLKNKMLKMFPDKDPEEMLCYVIQGVRALNEETPDTQYVIESLNSLNNKLPKILIRLQNRKKQFNNNKPL